ncbi:hypothetical protein [Streptomyces sp. CAU 1734]|uniref:hypothetical protein n=1 Tax=Streptomyces sp. CAU 1734 TaxID=3140360 RepID=UPI003260AC3D
MSVTEFDPRLVRWCAVELGAVPVESLMAAARVSRVLGVRLDDGREVVVKSRPDPAGRAAVCVTVQRRTAAAGFPCPKPLTDAVVRDGVAVHAEEWRPGGEPLRGTGGDAATRSARLLAALVRITAGFALPPPLPNPEWVRYDHTGPGHWPPNPLHDGRPGADRLPAALTGVAARARARLAAAADLPRVLGHADWEAQNLRWTGGLPHTVHDWDSMAWLPEAAVAGTASGAFASAEVPSLAPVESSEVFLAAYERERGRAFGADEREVAWAASLWPALHNARAEILWKHPAVALTEVLAQGGERLARAGA